MKQDLAKRFLDVQKKQRETFIRDINMKKIITNHFLYYAYEEELFQLQIKMGAENKKELMKNPKYLEYIKKRGKEGKRLL